MAVLKCTGSQGLSSELVKLLMRSIRRANFCRNVLLPTEHINSRNLKIL